MAGQEGAEILFHRWLLQAKNCRTENPEEADFFFVPFYLNSFQLAMNLPCQVKPRKKRWRKALKKKSLKKKHTFGLEVEVEISPLIFQRHHVDLEKYAENASEVVDHALDTLMDSLAYYDAYRKRDHVLMTVHEFWGLSSKWPELGKSILLVSE